MSHLRLRVEGPASGGSCVGREDGRVVFCRLSLPGETVDAQVSEDSRDTARFWRAEALEVVADSNPGRVEPGCPWFTPGGCGGCSWLHASGPLQLQIKREVLQDTLRRIGKVHADPEMTSLGPDSGWRTKVVLHVDDLGRAGLRGQRSHRIVTVTDCLQADPRLGLTEVLAQSWPPGAQVQVSVSDAGRTVVLRDRGKTTVDGPRIHHERVRGRRFEYPAQGFWQAHKDAPDVLSGRVIDLVEPVDGMRVADLYAGVGLFGLTLLDSFRGGHVDLVEGDRRAAEFAVRNAGEDARVRVLNDDVRTWARSSPSGFDVIVLDPPRAGAGRDVVAALTGCRPHTIVYVSCDPATLARDLAWFRDGGYAPDHVEGLDIFPGTAAQETVVRLRPE